MIGTVRCVLLLSPLGALLVFIASAFKRILSDHIFLPFFIISDNLCKSSTTILLIRQSSQDQSYEAIVSTTFCHMTFDLVGM